MTAWWHILKSTDNFGAAKLQQVWDEERAGRIVTAGYGNAPEGPGRDKLSKYRPGDRVFVYAPKIGLIALGKADDADPFHETQRTRHEHAHRKRVIWLATVSDLNDAVGIAQIRECGAYLPRTRATRLKADVAECLEQKLRQRSIS